MINSKDLLHPVPYSMQDQLLDQALEFHRKGQLKEALTIYQISSKIKNQNYTYF